MLSTLCFKKRHNFYFWVTLRYINRFSLYLTRTSGSGRPVEDWSNPWKTGRQNKSESGRIIISSSSSCCGSSSSSSSSRSSLLLLFTYGHSRECSVAIVRDGHIQPRWRRPAAAADLSSTPRCPRTRRRPPLRCVCLSSWRRESTAADTWSLQQSSSQQTAKRMLCYRYKVQEAQVMLTNPHDAFSGQSRSPNIVPFYMLGIVSSCAIVTLSLRGAVFFTIFDFKKCRDLEIGDWSHSRSLKVAPFERLCMVSYSVL